MIRKYSEKGLVKKKAKTEQTKLRHEMFEKHWQIKPHYCESCGSKLYGENKRYYHDHLLEKSKHPELDLEITNLYLVCEECHSKKTNGHPTLNHQMAIIRAEERLLTGEGETEKKEHNFYE